MKKLLSVVVLLSIMFSTFGNTYSSQDESEFGLCEAPQGTLRNFRYAPTGNGVSFFQKTRAGEAVIQDGKQVAGIYDYILTSLYSLDGQSLSFIAHTGGKDILIKDGKQVGGSYDAITDLQYSADSQSYSFITYDASSGKTTLMQDGISVYSDYDNVHSFLYAPKGKGSMFVGEKDKKQVVVKNGKQASSFHDAIIDLQYSRDGSSYAFIAYDSSTGKYSVIKDGKTLQNDYDFMTKLSYSDNSNAVAFVSYNTTDEQIVVAGNGLVISHPYGYINDYNFSRNDVLVSAIDDGQYVFVKNWRTVYSSDRSFAYTSHGDQLALTKQNGLKTTFELDGNQYGGKYSSISSIKYSSDGKSVAFIGGIKNKFVLVKDGEEVGNIYRNISDFQYSNDNSSFSFIADGKLYSNSCKIYADQSQMEQENVSIEIEQSKEELVEMLNLTRANLSNGDNSAYMNEVDTRVATMTLSQLTKLIQEINELDFDMRQNSALKDVIDYLEVKVLLAIIG